MALGGILHSTSQSIYIRTGNPPKYDASNIEFAANVNANILLNISVRLFKNILEYSLKNYDNCYSRWHFGWFPQKLMFSTFACFLEYLLDFSHNISLKCSNHICFGLLVNFLTLIRIRNCAQVISGLSNAILDICRGRRGHCPWRIFLSCGEILDVETFKMWRNFRYGDILHVEKFWMWRFF